MFLGSHLCDSRAALGRAFISHFGLSVDFALKLTPLHTPRGPNLETSVRLKAPHFSSQFNFFFCRVCVWMKIYRKLTGKAFIFLVENLQIDSKSSWIFISIEIIHPTIPVDCDMVLLRENEEKKCLVTRVRVAHIGPLKMCASVGNSQLSEVFSMLRKNMKNTKFDLKSILSLSPRKIYEKLISKHCKIRAHSTRSPPSLSLSPVCVERKFDFHFAFPQLSRGWNESKISPCTRKWPKFRNGTVKFQPQLTRKMANKKKFSLILSMADYESFFQVTWIWLWIFLFHLDVFFWIKLLLEKREKNVLIFQLFFFLFSFLSSHPHFESGEISIFRNYKIWAEIHQHNAQLVLSEMTVSIVFCCC